MLGEAGFLVWLIDQVEEETAINGAAGWDGDAYTLWVDDANHRVLAESSLWETETEAVEFYEAFSVYMDSRESGGTDYREAAAAIWDYETGVTLLSRQGRQVLIIVAQDRTTLDSVRNQFTNF